MKHLFYRCTSSATFAFGSAHVISIHSAFAAKLHSLGLVPGYQPCTCGGVELARHVLKDCPALAEQRRESGLEGVPLERILRSAEGMRSLEAFARWVLPLLHHVS